MMKSLSFGGGRHGLVSFKRLTSHFFFGRRKLSTCIVGSGPSGMYTAQYLLAKSASARVTILDELPTPFGLVRFGVAPDHAETKNVTHDFQRVLDDGRVSFYGNVSLGTDVSLAQLRSRFDAVVLCYGACADRSLALALSRDSAEGCLQSAVYSARRFVNWYNGHPHFGDAVNDEHLASAKDIVIVGNGNVAVDCARVIAQINDLSKTDIAQNALCVLTTQMEAIRSNNDSLNISLVGRRGAAQAAFSNKELRELSTAKANALQIPVSSHIRADEMSHSLTDASAEEIAAKRAVKRKMDILGKCNTDVDDTIDSAAAGGKVHIDFRFLLNPKEIITDSKSGRISALVCERTALSGDSGKQLAVGTGELCTLPCDMLLTSVGYESQCVEPALAVHWDADGSCFKHDANGRMEAGLYCGGWVSRNPLGLIGTNITDAMHVVQSILKDEHSLLEATAKKEGDAALQQLLETKGVTFVDKNGWNRIDEFETALGKDRAKTREKLLDVSAMVEVSHASMS